MGNPLNYPDDPILRDAFDRGIEAADAAASWVTDGNESDESRRRKLAMMEEGDPAVYDLLPARPNLSGEYADDPTPQSLARDVTGLDDFSETPELVDQIAEAFEDGVSETFELACEAELRAWISS